MIWFFHRGHERLQYEIRHADGPVGYELVVRRPDGDERIERFQDSASLLERSAELQRGLVAEGWATDSADPQTEWQWVAGGSSRPPSPPDSDR